MAHLQTIHLRSEKEIREMGHFEFHEYVETFCAESKLTDRAHRRCLGDLLIIALERRDYDAIREISSALVIS